MDPKENMEFERGLDNDIEKLRYDIVYYTECIQKAKDKIEIIQGVRR